MRDVMTDWLWRAEAKRPLALDAALAVLVAAICYALPGDGPLDPASGAVLGAAVMFLALPSLRAARATVEAGHDVRLGLCASTAHFAGEDLAELTWQLALLSTVMRTAEPENWRHGLSYLVGIALLIASLWLTR